jgi:hypothetical protein
MVIGSAPLLGIADQSGQAHAVPGVLVLAVLVAIVVVVIFAKRGR